MVIQLPHAGRTVRADAYALLLVLVFTGITLSALATALSWSSTRAVSDERATRFHATQLAAEAAAARVAGRIVHDFEEGGPAAVTLNLNDYRHSVPSKREHPIWAGYEFSDNRGQANRTHVAALVSWDYGTVRALPGGGEGYRTVLRIESQARSLDTDQLIAAAVQQEVELASVPLFSFSVFYHLDLEVNPPNALTINGRVHSNRSIYSQPERTVQFNGPVTACGSLSTLKHPADPVARRYQRAQFNGERVTGAKTMSLGRHLLPAGSSLHALLEVPPKGESPTSQSGQTRLYNKADLIVLFTASGMRAFSGAYNKFSVNIPPAVIASFLDDSTRFYDMRENRHARAVQLDGKQLLNNLPALKSLLSRDLHLLYIADLRKQAVTDFAAVRIVNADVLPPGGFTLATPNPLYVKGDFNLGCTVTTGKGKSQQTITVPPVPACLAADAVTLLSGSWDDADSGNWLASRRADSTALNAAILTGIVPTRDGYYSGGLENSLRLLEDWTKHTFAFQGAIAVLFESQTATAPWGATASVFDSPDRQWHLNPVFTSNTMPPGTPEVMIVGHTRPQIVEARSVR